jgi:hypothetical protein
VELIIAKMDAPTEPLTERRSVTWWTSTRSFGGCMAPVAVTAIRGTLGMAVRR